MKKIIILILAVVMCVSITACNSGNKRAYEVSKVAYDNIDIAYEIVEQIGSDIYDAWLLGIYDKEELIENGAEYLASELLLSEDEIKAGIGCTFAEVLGMSWNLSESYKKDIIETADDSFYLFEDEMFTFCVLSVINAYEINGKMEEAQIALDAAKTNMKELSDKYSDYEHYPNLKGYYTTTSSFFDFCQNPTGSFEQVKDTINDYKNEARDYISDLDYIFEE